MVLDHGLVMVQFGRTHSIMNVGDRNAFVPLSKKTPPSLAVNPSLRMLLHGLKKLDMECVESSIAYDREALLLLSLSAASSNGFSRSSGIHTYSRQPALVRPPIQPPWRRWA